MKNLAILLFVVILFSSCGTSWQLALTDVDVAAAGQIQAVLDDAGISSRINVSTGGVLVPSQHVEQAIEAVLMSDSLWSHMYTFQDAMADLDIGVTSGWQNEAALRLREAEMAEMLMRISSIETATVGLSASYATVNVTGSRALTLEDGEIIALMVSRMAEGLSPENVTVIDDNLDVLF